MSVPSPTRGFPVPWAEGGPRRKQREQQTKCTPGPGTQSFRHASPGEDRACADVSVCAALPTAAAALWGFAFGRETEAWHRVCVRDLSGSRKRQGGDAVNPSLGLSEEEEQLARCKCAFLTGKKFMAGTGKSRTEIEAVRFCLLKGERSGGARDCRTSLLVLPWCAPYLV